MEQHCFPMVMMRADVEQLVLLPSENELMCGTDKEIHWGSNADGGSVLLRINCPATTPIHPYCLTNKTVSKALIIIDYLSSYLYILDEFGDKDSKADGPFRKVIFTVEAKYQLFNPWQHWP